MNIGDYTQCPECARMGRVVWVSKNGKTAGIQCHASHQIINRPDSYGFIARTQSKANKDSVFLVEIK